MADPLAQASFPIDPVLTAVANRVTNEGLIADRVLPVQRIGRQTYKYLKIPRGENFTLPDTLVGAMGEPGSVTFTGQRETGFVEGHALISPVPIQDQEQALEDYDPRARAVVGIRELMLLKKEEACAAMVFDADNYATANKETLTGTDQWSHADSEPARKVREIADTMVMRPNIMVIGQLAATELILHPALVQAFHGTTGSQGVVPLAFVAEQMGLQEILVAGAWYNNANIGQDTSFERVWGKKAALLHRSSVALPDADGFNQILTFGATFVWPLDGQDFGATSWTDPKPGVSGVEYVKYAGRYNFQLIANDFGYLLSDVIA